MPRGTIHQGYCLEDVHSLHITISCHQRNTYGDLLEKVLTSAISYAMQNDVEFRKGLPLDYLRFMGRANTHVDSENRSQFISRLTKLVPKIITQDSIDAGVDQMGKRFIHDSLPPYLTPSESKR